MTERVVTVDGKVLWTEPYHFSRLSRVGDEFCRKGQWYTVVSCTKVGDEITTVVKTQNWSAITWV